MPWFAMTVGISGSGKTTWANKWLQNPDNNVVVIDSDEIRREIFGDENNQSDNASVFAEMFGRTYMALANGHNVIYVATNLNGKRRQAILENLREYFPDLFCRCYVIQAEYSTCCTRNNNRERIVPSDGMERQNHIFQYPRYSEGWDNISPINNN